MATLDRLEMMVHLVAQDRMLTSEMSCCLSHHNARAQVLQDHQAHLDPEATTVHLVTTVLPETMADPEKEDLQDHPDSLDSPDDLETRDHLENLETCVLALHLQLADPASLVVQDHLANPAVQVNPAKTETTDHPDNQEALAHVDHPVATANLAAQEIQETQAVQAVATIAHQPVWLQDIRRKHHLRCCSTTSLFVVNSVI